MGQNGADLKRYTTKNKPIEVARETVIIPKELINLHQNLFMIADIFFVNGIPSFIFIGRNITFTLVSYLSDRKSITIFKALNKIYMYYLKRGFCITTLYVDG